MQWSWLNFLTESHAKREKVEEVFAGREPLTDAQLWERFFEQHGVSADTVARIRRILSEILEADLSRIRDQDDFSEELAFFWAYDSLADVEIVQALEAEFGITISDADAAAMKTLKDIVLSVHKKLPA
jgi:acyl carrier protein